MYSVQLRQTGDYHQITDGVYTVPDCNDKGNFIKKFVIVESLSDDEVTAYVCSCDKSVRANVLAAFDDGKLLSYMSIAPAYCVHIEETVKLFPEPVNDAVDRDIATSIYRLTSKLLATYCHDTRTYGVLTEGQHSMKCLTCTSKVTSCVHIKAYKNNAMDHGFDPHSRKVSDEFSCISSDRIPYPLQDDDATKFNGYVSGRQQYPQHLLPYDDGRTCVHGSLFDSRDPVAQQWIVNRDALIHTKHASIPCVTFFRPSLGDCACKMHFDGADDLLLNLDNKHLFTYSWLFDILHDSQETRYPLAAAFRSANRTRTACGFGPLGDHCYNHLRVAYNCFLRLLDLDFPQLFECHHCGKDVDCIIMDGIMMGSRKDLLPTYDKPTPAATLIPECSMDDRVFLANAAARKKLGAYTGLHRGRYQERHQLSTKDFKDLWQSLKDRPSLQQVVKEAGRTCPVSLHKLLGEISRGSPTCGIIQLSDPEACTEARNILTEVAAGNHCNVGKFRKLLEMSCPMLIDFLTANDINPESRSHLMFDLLESLDAPFKNPVPDPSKYAVPSIANEELEFFPGRPLLRGAASYKADASKSALATGCRKDSYRHNALTPGLFTMFCPHGVCLGFQIMEHCESPKTAFDILVQRFSRMPRLVIYDNACKLHLYCLKREPSRFRNTRFMVDRLHFRKGHIGCSLGYSMDSYESDNNIASINSQANEQANASLRRLATQLTYMPPKNVIKHTSVFLALRNIDKMLKM